MAKREKQPERTCDWCNRYYIPRLPGENNCRYCARVFELIGQGKPIPLGKLRSELVRPMCLGARIEIYWKHANASERFILTNFANCNVFVSLSTGVSRTRQQLVDMAIDGDMLWIQAIKGGGQ